MSDLRHHRPPLMQKENIRNRQRSQTLSTPSKKPHHNPCNQLICITFRNPRPDCADGIPHKARNIHWPSSVFQDERHPEEIAYTLKKRGCCEEVGDFRDCGIEQWTWRPEKGHGNFDDGDRGPSCKEVADEHSERDDDCDIVFEDRRPGMLAFAFQYSEK
jgi:hypothetical protein